LSVGRFDPSRFDTNERLEGFRADENFHPQRRDRDHSKAFSTWSYEADQPLSLEMLRETLGHLPSGIYRAKGVVYTADEPECRAVVQVFYIIPARTQIVAIGASGAIEGEELRNKLEQCISTRIVGR
jgi:G3E family GTPase